MVSIVFHFISFPMILVCVRVDRILYVSHRNCNRKLQVIDLKYFLWHVSFLDNY